MIHRMSVRNFTVVLTLCLSAELAAQAPLATSSEAELRPLLNSERIAMEFGNSGIDVLESDARVRVSNLYNLRQGIKICRTFAVVHFSESIETAYSVEHEAILSGQSIGAVFAQHGWTIEKINRYFGVLDSTDRVARLMGEIAPRPLAVHLYDFKISKPGTSLIYATIAEVHHPDYLTVADLQRIYGAVVNGAYGVAEEQPELALTRDKMN
jgi:hypothetical protein